MIESSLQALILQQKGKETERQILLGDAVSLPSLRRLIKQRASLRKTAMEQLQRGFDVLIVSSQLDTVVSFGEKQNGFFFLVG